MTRTAGNLAELADSYQRGRAADVRSVADLVLRHLVGAPASTKAAGVVVAADLTPATGCGLGPRHRAGRRARGRQPDLACSDPCARVRNPDGDRRGRRHPFRPGRDPHSCRRRPWGGRRRPLRTGAVGFSRADRRSPRRTRSSCRDVGRSCRHPRRHRDHGRREHRFGRRRARRGCGARRWRGLRAHRVPVRRQDRRALLATNKNASTGPSQRTCNRVESCCARSTSAATSHCRFCDRPPKPTRFSASAVFG